MTHSPQPGAPRARIPGPQQPPPPYPRIGAGLWKRCLGGGLALWALLAAVTCATGTGALLPSVIVLGGFLVPVAFVLWAYERHARDLGVSAVLGCFLAGGALGVLAASAVEPYLLHPSLGTFLGVGLLRVTAQLGALVFALRRQPGIRGTRAGLVLGAATGCGFAALESCGYALDAALRAPGAGPGTLLETELLRGLAAPVGQGLWAAVAGAALLSCRRPNGQFRLAAPVVRTCLGVGVLHALWDASHGVAARLTARLTGAAPPPQPFAPGRTLWPGAGQGHLFTLFSVGSLVLVALLGVVWARSLAQRDLPWRNTP